VAAWRRQAEGILATGFSTFYTVCFERLYVLCGIEHATRRAHVLGITEHPYNGLVTQGAQELAATWPRQLVR